jgi:pimeloyl-ACP methyl ester carboxylesterase
VEAPIKYAKSGDVHIAYRVFGDGPRDIILVPGTVSHVELYWELPTNEYLLRRLCAFARVIVFDKRGQGLSDRVAQQTIDERVDDVRAVMDAAGSKRATIYGWSEGGQLSITFAARHPERTAGLILYGSCASMKSEPWVVRPEQFELFTSAIARHWGEGILVKVNAPSRRKDEAFLQWFGRLERAVASPGAIVTLLRANYELDVSELLHSIHAPTLILHREGDALIPVQAGRYLAWNIPGAKYFELPGGDHLLQAFDLDVLDMLINRIEEFVTRVRPLKRHDEVLGKQLEAEALSLSDRAEVAADADSESIAEAIVELERCRETIASGGDIEDIEGLLARAQALVASASGSWEESESQFVRALANFRRRKMAWQEARTFEVWGRSLMAGLDRRGLIERLDSTIQTYRRRSRANDDDAANGTKITAQEESSPAVFQREGDYWTVSWQGKIVRLKDAKGFHYIAYLLADAGHQVPAYELASLGRTTQVEGAAILDRTVVTLGDAGQVIDSTARARYKRRIDELRSELAEAERLNDTERASRLRWEFEALSDQIASAVGLGGRARINGSHRERARQMVTKAVKTAIVKIRAGNAPLGHHLATSIKTGNYCTYDPGPQHLAWRL